MAPAHAGADWVPYIIEQFNIEIAAKEEENVITVDSNPLSGSIPRYIVGVHTRFFQVRSIVEEHSMGVNCGTGTINVINLSCAVAQKQLWRLSGVVVGKLEALSEAAGPNAEGVGDVDVPTAGGAVMS